MIFALTNMVNWTGRYGGRRKLLSSAMKALYPAEHLVMEKWAFGGNYERCTDCMQGCIWEHEDEGAKGGDPASQEDLPSPGRLERCGNPER
jgi:hypothetical protein